MTRTDSLDEHRLYDVLSNERRRVCVRRLRECESDVPVQRLADELAAEVADGGANADGGFRRSVYISLVQTHLPKLDRYGVVEYDDERKVVRPGENLAAVDAQLSKERRARFLRSLSAVAVLGSIAAVAASLLAYGAVDAAGRLAVSGAVVAETVVASIVALLYLCAGRTAATAIQ